MIWLRLFIALIALTISSDLSAWAQTQVNSPEGFYDCTEVANGKKVRDRTQYKDCCLPSEMRFCEGCVDHRSFCEKQTQVCGTTTTPDKNNLCCSAHPSPCNDCNRPSMTSCETQLNQCGATADVGCGCGNGKSCYGCDRVANSGKTDPGCGCGQPAPGPCGCSACPPPPASCNHAPVKLSNRNLISLHFGTKDNDSNGVLSDGPQYREICKNALGASSYDAVVYYDINEARFSSPGNNSICSYKPNSSTEKHCVNAKNVANPKHISQISCRCN
ncbi:MAG: hypothetical protein NTV65_01630 [Proteobacteria bacterium]|nr:hypothetical protein [Pseudomonadota bacterium]